MSIICRTAGPNDRSVPSLSSSRISNKDFLVGPKVSLCSFGFALASDCGLWYFRQIMMSTSSSVSLLLARIIPDVSSASFRKS